MQLHLFLSILSPLHQAFGSIMGWLYGWLQNYGLVLIVFNFAIKVFLIPTNVRMQKNMARQVFLQDDINEIKRVYADDPQMAQQVQMDLMKSAGVSMTGGCLPQIIQFLIIIAMYEPIRRPLHYIAGVSQENLNNITGLLINQGHLPENAMRLAATNDVNILAALRENASALAQSIQNGWIELGQVLDLKFLGMDLGKVPSFNPKIIFGEETRSTYLPLLLLVIVMIITMLISNKLVKINQVNAKSKEEIDRDKRNPAKEGQQANDQAAAMSKSMMLFMPLMMLWLSFTLPAAMTLYWIISNIFAIVQTILSNIYYVQPAREILEARQKEKQIPRRRRKSE